MTFVTVTIFNKSFRSEGAPMETPDLSLSDNIDSTDDLVPSLQVVAKFH